MVFNTIIFATALYALSTETIEDAFVLMIYNIIYGKKSVIFGLAAAAAIVALSLLAVTYYKIPQFELYSEYVILGSGIFLFGIGCYWIVRYFLVKKGIVKEESKQAKSSIRHHSLSFLMVLVELLEILAILIPFALANYVTETLLSAGLSVLISIGFMVIVGRRLRAKLENRLTQLKLFAGVALVFTGTMITFHLK